MAATVVRTPPQTQITRAVLQQIHAHGHARLVITAHLQTATHRAQTAAVVIIVLAARTVRPVPVP